MIVMEPVHMRELRRVYVTVMKLVHAQESRRGDVIVVEAIHMRESQRIEHSKFQLWLSSRMLTFGEWAFVKYDSCII